MSSHAAIRFHDRDGDVNDRCAKPLQVIPPKAWAAYTEHYGLRKPDVSNFGVVLRKSSLAVRFPTGATEYLNPLGDGTFRIFMQLHSPPMPCPAAPYLVAEYTGYSDDRAVTP